MICWRVYYGDFTIVYSILDKEIWYVDICRSLTSWSQYIPFPLNCANVVLAWNRVLVLSLSSYYYANRTCLVLNIYGNTSLVATSSTSVGYLSSIIVLRVLIIYNLYLVTTIPQCDSVYPNVIVINILFFLMINHCIYHQEMRLIK